MIESLIALAVFLAYWRWRGRKERAKERFVRAMMQGRTKDAAKEIERLL